MKYLNQINAVLVIVGLGLVFYSFSQTFFGNGSHLIQVVSSGKGAPAESLPTDSEAPLSETHTPRGLVPSTSRPAPRESSATPTRRLPLGSSPQIVQPRNAESSGRTPTESRTRILTTPPTNLGRAKRDNQTAQPTPNPAHRSEFLEAVDKLRNQELQRQQERSTPIRPGSSPSNTQEEGRRRQTSPPPARSSMSNRRPPR